VLIASWWNALVAAIAKAPELDLEKVVKVTELSEEDELNISMDMLAPIVTDIMADIFMVLRVTIRVAVLAKARAQ